MSAINALHQAARLFRLGAPRQAVLARHRFHRRNEKWTPLQAILAWRGSARRKPTCCRATGASRLDPLRSHIDSDNSSAASIFLYRISVVALCEVREH